MYLKMNIYIGLLFVALLPTFIKVTHCAPATISYGEKLILHTTAGRLRHHREALLQQRPTTYTPDTHPHHLHLRSIDNMVSSNNNFNLNAVIEFESQNGDSSVHNGVEQSFCQKINAALRKSKEQTDHSFNLVSSELKIFTLIRYNTDKEEYERQWRLVRIGLPQVIPTNVSELKDRLQNLPWSCETISNELITIYKALKQLQHVYTRILDKREKSEQLRNDYINDMKKLDRINKVLKGANDHIGYDLIEIKSGMEKIGVEIPVTPNIDNMDAIINNNSAEWLMLKEHINILNYMKGVYDVLTECKRY